MKTYFSPSRKGLFNLPVGDDSVLLTEEVAAALMVELKAGKVLEADAEGNPIAVEAPKVPSYEEIYLSKPIAERLTIQLGRLNADYDQAVAVLNVDYPAAETHTWTLQVTEARAYQAWIDGGRVGDAPEVPFLVELNEGRVAANVGDGFEDLISRILANDAVYSPALAGFTAYRHGIEKQLRTAEAMGDDVAFNAISWTFAQPEAPAA